LLGDPSNRGASSGKETTEKESHSRPQEDGPRQSRGQINASQGKAGHGLTRIDTDGVRAAAPTGLGGNASAEGPTALAVSPPSEEADETQGGLKLKTPTGVPVVVAPNGVDLADLGRRLGREVLEDRFPELRDRRWIVFMSRLHPKKGVDVLLRAWARQKEVTSDVWRVTSPDADKSFSPLVSWSLSPILILAGSDLIGYRKEVEKMVKELGLEDSVVITGEVQGEMKDCLLANAEVFVLPSYSENFGIVVAEALSWGRPVITTTGTPWKEVADVGAGWWVKPEEEALAGALAQALAKGREEIEAMGAKGRELVERSYTWASPAAKLIAAYEAALSIRH
jgi:glycosyltransferase involved in cell wall biosynthesis